jgi:lysozyme
MSMNFRPSERAIDIIKHHEGLRLHAYDDLDPHKRLREGDEVKGTVTIGYGHTKTARPGMEINEGEATCLLRQDLSDATKGVNRLIENSKLEVYQHQFDALVSFAFNVGVKALEDSTLLRLFLEGKIDEAADEFLRWRYSNGQELPGLAKRRIDERSLFLGFKPSFMD